MREQPDIHARLMAQYRQGESSCFCVGSDAEFLVCCLQSRTGTMFVSLVCSLLSHGLRTLSTDHICFLVITFVFACVCIKIWPTGMTIWALLVALLIGTSSSTDVLRNVLNTWLCSCDLHFTDRYDPGSDE